MNAGNDIRRRSVLKIAGLLGATMASPLVEGLLCRGAEAAEAVPLRLMNPHTSESYNVHLFVGSEWNAPGLVACDWMMRDWRQKSVVHCDRRIYAALYVLQRFFQSNEPVQINSGFRSKMTNDMLRSRSLSETGGRATWMTPAINSMHTHAQAVDFVLPGVGLSKTADAVWSLKLGGLGRYPTFTHMDTGLRRTWGNG
jgi:uncharacterized protein YcbK (DUF882 family)